MAEIVLLRHGHALSTGEAGMNLDSERPLSAEGEQAALAAARHLKASGFVPDLIISSPFLRAASTAEIAAGVFPDAKRRTDLVISGGPVQTLLDLVQRLSRGNSSVLIVGHQPTLGAIAGFLLGSDSFDLSPAGFVRLAPAKDNGAAALVEFHVPSGHKEKSC